MGLNKYHMWLIRESNWQKARNKDVIDLEADKAETPIEAGTTTTQLTSKEALNSDQPASVSTTSASFAGKNLAASLGNPHTPSNLTILMRFSVTHSAKVPSQTLQFLT
jgi:hypothetical protein